MQVLLHLHCNRNCILCKDNVGGGMGGCTEHITEHRTQEHWDSPFNFSLRRDVLSQKL